MTEYERAMLKLKLLELTQRQTLIAMAAFANPNDSSQCVVEEANDALDNAIAGVEKLLS